MIDQTASIAHSWTSWLRLKTLRSFFVVTSTVTDGTTILGMAASLIAQSLGGRDPWWFPSAPTEDDENAGVNNVRHVGENRFSALRTCPGGDRFDPCNNFHGSMDEFKAVSLGVFNEAGLLRHFGIDDALALRFFARVYRAYDDRGDVPFHCALHVQTVLGGVHCLFRQLRDCNHGPFSPLETLALYVAAICHDAGHFGVTNAYLRDTRHPLYTLFPAATLEHFHAQVTETILLDPEEGIAACLPEAGGVRSCFLAEARDVYVV